MPVEACIVLGSDYTLTSSTAEQKLFNSSTNGRLTLAAGKYWFQSLIYLTTMNAASGNAAFDILGAGSATIAAPILYDVEGVDNTTPTTAVATIGVVSVNAQTGAAMVTAGTGTGLRALMNGMFTVTAAGTVVPSITLLTANAAVVKAGSYFTCRMLMASTQTTVGQWD
jgi:hypothetical protein